MDTLIKILQVIVALSILVLVHEFGHFFFARLFKIKVEKFYLFFDAWFSLVKFKPRNSDTEYGIGWLPLGGYCKIAGMIDESMDKEALSKDPQPWEFRSKPAWQRFFVMFGGVFFNFILAIIIYSATLMSWGEEYLKNSEAIYGIHCNELALEIGFRHGDRIISFDGEKIERFNELQVVMARNQASSALVIRDGDTINIEIPRAKLPEVLNTPGMFSLRIPFEVMEIQDSSPNKEILLPGDRVISAGTVESPIIQDIQPVLQINSGNTIKAEVMRNGSRQQLELTVDENGMLGIILEGDLNKFFVITREEYSITRAIPSGFNKAVSTIGNYFKELGLIFSPETKAYKSVGSFISIGKIFPSSWDWQIFWNITAWLSIMLAVLNLLPIPALDGGHILFLIYEIITGRKPSDKFLEIAQMAGMLILFAIMFLAFGNDIYRLFK